MQRTSVCAPTAPPPWPLEVEPLSVKRTMRTIVRRAMLAITSVRQPELAHRLVQVCLFHHSVLRSLYPRPRKRRVLTRVRPARACGRVRGALVVLVVACPSGHAGTNIPSGCTCILPGQTGATTPAVGAPFFSGGCQPVPCPSTSHGDTHYCLLQCVYVFSLQRVLFFTRALCGVTCRCRCAVWL